MSTPKQVENVGKHEFIPGAQVKAATWRLYKHEHGSRTRVSAAPTRSVTVCVCVSVSWGVCPASLRHRNHPLRLLQTNTAPCNSAPQRKADQHRGSTPPHSHWILLAQWTAPTIRALLNSHRCPERRRKSAYLTFPATNYLARTRHSDQSESRTRARAPITGQKSSRNSAIGCAEAGAGPIAEQDFTAEKERKCDDDMAHRQG